MSSIDPTPIDLEDDPNEASRNQLALKRVETAIRRFCDCNLLLALDGIAMLGDEALMKSEMLKLKRILEQKSSEERMRHAEGTH